MIFNFIANKPISEFSHLAVFLFNDTSIKVCNSESYELDRLIKGELIMAGYKLNHNRDDDSYIIECPDKVHARTLLQQLRKAYNLDA